MENLKIESTSYARIFSILNDWNISNDNIFKYFAKNGDENAKLFIKSRPRGKNAKAYSKIINDLIKETLTAFSYICKQKHLNIEKYDSPIVTCLTTNELYNTITDTKPNSIMMKFNQRINKYREIISEELKFLLNSDEVEHFKPIISKINLLYNRLYSDTFEFKNIMGFLDENLKDKF